MADQDAFVFSHADKGLTRFPPNVEQISVEHEWLLAGVALTQAWAGSLALELTNAGSLATMRANRPIRPQPGFDVFESGFLAKESRGVFVAPFWKQLSGQGRNRGGSRGSVPRATQRACCLTPARRKWARPDGAIPGDANADLADFDAGQQTAER
jgi:hypothetical protein